MTRLPTLAAFQEQVGEGHTDLGHRAWVKEGHVEAYLRVTKRVWDGKYVDTIDFASGEVPESKQGNGHFTRFLIKLEEWADDLDRALYFENVINPILEGMLVRRGYAQAGLCFLREPRGST